MKKDQGFIKRENHNLMLELIQQNEMVTRAKLARMANLSPTTVSRIVESLLEMNLIKETDRYTSGVGRKAIILTLNPDSFITLGIEIDENMIKYSFFDFIGNEISKYQRSKTINESPESVVEKIKSDVFQLMGKENISEEKVVGACIGLPGIINNDSGVVVKSVQLGWENVLLGDTLEGLLTMPVTIDNELKLRAIAENYFTESKYNSTVVIGFGYGVGAAVIKNGEVFRGSANSAGEIGHTVVDPNGMLCTCGNFGCLQTFIAEGFLVQEASKQLNVRNVMDIIDASIRGENWATKILNRAVTYAGITVNNCACLYNPDKVILTGSMIEKSPLIQDEIIQASKNQIWSPLKDSFVIEKSKMGGDGVIVGAGIVSRRIYISQLNYEEQYS